MMRMVATRPVSALAGALLAAGCGTGTFSRHETSTGASEPSTETTPPDDVGATPQCWAEPETVSEGGHVTVRAQAMPGETQVRVTLSDAEGTRELRETSSNGGDISLRVEAGPPGVVSVAVAAQDPDGVARTAQCGYAVLVAFCGDGACDSDEDCTSCADDCGPCDPDCTEDRDDDGTPDCSDNCPDDPDKTEPSQCGCGVPETDCADFAVACALNPYAAVHWPTWAQYKANFHTHTTRSDGSQDPDEVIDEYNAAGYSILAITDHNRITWPWTNYGRDPAILNMLAVRGDEYSNAHHLNAFHDFSNGSLDLEAGLPHIEASGGLAHINHPGRYSSPADWDWYTYWYQTYPSCVGMEVINRNDRYSSDRRLWDNINESLFDSDRRLVWGYANDDKHSKSHLYYSFQFMLMPELTEEALRQSQTTGASYFCNEPNRSGDAQVPRISDISVDHAAQTIEITASDWNTIVWIGPGTLVVSDGAVFDFSEYYDQPFVRAVLQGPFGKCYTQPFGFVTDPNSP